MQLSNSELMSALNIAVRWSNENQGVVSIGLFVITAVFGWASGIFGSLRRRPNFTVRFIERPLGCSTFVLGTDEFDRVLHRTAIVLYLRISNVGSAAASIDDVEVAYRWPISLPTNKWWQFRTHWLWLHQTPALSDFSGSLGENMQVFPFLFQRNQSIDLRTDTFLQPGAAVNGIVYFESPQCWGTSYPVQKNGKVTLKVRITDGFGRRHRTSAKQVPVLPLSMAREFNSQFGNTNAISHQPVSSDASEKFEAWVSKNQQSGGGVR